MTVEDQRDVTPDEVPPRRSSGIDRWRKTAGLVSGPLLALLLLLIPLGDLSTAEQRVAAVAALVITYWVTEAIPLPVTALLGAALITVLGIVPGGEVLLAFGDQVIFLFIGSFMIARAMQIHKLDLRIAYTLMSRSWVGGSNYRTIWAIGLTTWGLSWWISNTATAAMLMPVAIAFARPAGSSLSVDADTPVKDRRFATALLLMVAYAASVGGMVTPVSTPSNMIGIALIDDATGERINFLRWMSFALPISAVMLVAIFVTILIVFRPPRDRVPAQIASVRARRDRFGPWSAGERNAMIAFLTAVTLWVTPGLAATFLGAGHPTAVLLQERLPEGVVALIAASLLFLLPTDWRRRRATLDWDQAVKIDWGIVLLFGGGIALGKTMFSTGLAETVGSGLVSLLGAESESAISALGILLGSVVGQTSSNTASANIFVPMILAIAETLSVSSLVVAIATTLGTSMSFMLPISTPPNAIVYSSRLVRVSDMLRAGIVVSIFGILIVWLASLWLIPTMLELTR